MSNRTFALTLLLVSACGNGSVPGGGQVQARSEGNGTCGIDVYQYDEKLTEETYQNLDIGSPVVLKATGCSSDYTYKWGKGDLMEDAMAEPVEGIQYFDEISDAVRIWMVVWQGKELMEDLSTYVDLDVNHVVMNNTFIVIEPRAPQAAYPMTMKHVVGIYTGEEFVVSEYYEDVTSVAWKITNTEGTVVIEEEQIAPQESNPGEIVLPGDTLEAGVLYSIIATTYRADGSVIPSPLRTTRPRPW